MHTEQTAINSKPAQLPKRFLRLTEVMRRTGLSRTTIWREQREDRFPQSHQLTPNTIGFLESDIDEWIDARLATAQQRGGK
jgi:prophage regulatory protein